MTVKMVSVAEILKKVQTTADCYDVVDGPHEWFRMIENKMLDRQTPAIIRAIEEYGFLDPVCIEEDEDYWHLGNGHHRLCIAILLGLDEIPVDFSNWYSDASTTNSRRIKEDYQPGDHELAQWISATAVSYEDTQEKILVR